MQQYASPFPSTVKFQPLKGTVARENFQTEYVGVAVQKDVFDIIFQFLGSTFNLLGIFIEIAHRSETEFILVLGSNINVHLYDTGGFVTFHFQQISQSFFVSLKCFIISLNLESSIELNLFFAHDRVHFIGIAIYRCPPLMSWVWTVMYCQAEVGHQCILVHTVQYSI